MKYVKIKVPDQMIWHWHHDNGCVEIPHSISEAFSLTYRKYILERNNKYEELLSKDLIIEEFESDDENLLSATENAQGAAELLKNEMN